MAYRDDERRYSSHRRLDTEYDTSWSDPPGEESREQRESLRWMSSRDREQFGRGERFEDSPPRGGDYSASSGQQTFGGMSGGYAGALLRPSQTHAGRGPKNWRRSEERIREDVAHALTQHPDVDASEIEIEVSGTDVTLSGTVETRHQKRAAENCAWDVSGVKDVHNRLRLSAPAPNL
jgi:hypothetical protein